jgi:histidinol-phosphate phosphatase family protein
VAKAVFLDRDGVINRLEVGDYVTSWDKFVFIPGAQEAIAALSRAGYLIIIITNQSVINRGLLSEAQLSEMHELMRAEVERSGGRIDAIYYCPHTPEENCPCRKPGTGMFDRVNEDYDIDYEQSWFVGDFDSDREVAENMDLKFILAQGDGGLLAASRKILQDQ